MTKKKINPDAIHSGGKMEKTGWYLWREKDPSGTMRWIIFYNSIANRLMGRTHEWRGPFTGSMDAAKAGGPGSRLSTWGGVRNKSPIVRKSQLNTLQSPFRLYDRLPPTMNGE